LRKVQDAGMRDRKDPTIPVRRRAFALTGVAIAAVPSLAVLSTAPNPSAPRSIVMATGSPDSACHPLGQRYRSLLARQGVEVHLLQAAGSIENLGRRGPGLVRSSIAARAPNQPGHCVP
jgi:TRAP-type uncharacterized transport system substrate-binding protein